MVKRQSGAQLKNVFLNASMIGENETKEDQVSVNDQNVDQDHFENIDLL